MAIKHRNQLKASFKTGAIPTEADFGDLIDSALNLDDDGLAVDSGKRLVVGTGAPAARLTVQGDFDVPLSGTIAVAAATAPGNVAATGVGTRFTKELTAGAKLTIGNVELTVVSIGGDTQMTVTRAAGAAVSASQGFVRGNLLSLRDADGSTQLLVDGTGTVYIGSGTPGANLQVSGTLVANRLQGDGSLIQKLDAGAITSGSVDAARLPASVTTDPIGASRIPNLNASKIATGILDAARLPASVTTDPIGANRIPNLDASKIATGILDAARLPVSVTTDPIGASRIPNLDASKIATGILDAARLPASVTTDPIGASRIPNLDASKIATGTLDAARLPASVTAGAIDASRVSGILLPARGGTGLNAAGAAGNILRSNGAAWESTRLTASDLPDLHLSFIQNTTAQQAGSNFNISGTGKAQILEANQQFNIAGQSVLSVGGDWGNVFVGTGAGHADTTGEGNTFVGLSAGTANTTGQLNTFVGTETGGGNTTGNNNSFFGQNAGPKTTGGGFNTFVGTNAGTTNATGEGNTFLGESSGWANTTGNNNVIIGRSANTGSGDLTNAIAIGWLALVTQSNSLVLGSIAGVNNASNDTRVGIGTTAPGSLLTLKASSQAAPALEIAQGALKVTGAGINTGTFVLIHEVTAGSIQASRRTNASAINNSYANGDKNAILIITPMQLPSAVTLPVPAYVVYDVSIQMWLIVHFDSTPMSAGNCFNVLIVKS